MQKFIPFEDDWDALERLRPEDLIPFSVGLLPTPGTVAQRHDPPMSSMAGPALASARDAARRAR